MVTIEQGDGQFQGTGGNTETRNPQQAPGSLQVNGVKENSLQGVVGGASLFSNPQSNAIITISGNSTTTAESLVASDAAPKSASGLSSAQSGAVVGVVALLFLVGGFLIIRRLTAAD